MGLETVDLIKDLNTALMLIVGWDSDQPSWCDDGSDLRRLVLQVNGGEEHPSSNVPKQAQWLSTPLSQVSVNQ